MRMLVFLLLFCPAIVVADAPPTLTVHVVGLKSSSGRVGCSVYDAAHAKAFPTDADAARARKWASIAAGSATFSFDGLSAGTYALACFHDENANGKLDTNWLGIPNEGVASSNDAKGRFGPPKFDAAKFVLNGAPLALTVRMSYL